MAIDCYEAEKYDMALEFAEKAFDLKCNQHSMMTIMLIVSIIDGNLEKTLDVCDKYYTLFYTYDEVSRFIFRVKNTLEVASKYMIDNRKPEFAYLQEQETNKLPDVITLPLLRVINLLEKLKYLDSRSVYGLGNGFSQAQIENLIRQLRALMIELNNKNVNVGKSHRNSARGPRRAEK
ncbi:MAG: hypothetical protein LBK94_03695 [Prevotellaceae bacterium]|nr:hypothetical protein [Prevotellaceae bacterium]